MGHGGGGALSRDLIEHVFLPAFGNPVLERLGDSAVLDDSGRIAGGRLAFSTDSYVVRPLAFPGRLDRRAGRQRHGQRSGDERGGAARYLSAAFILEEGLAIADLAGIVARMAAAARRAGVRIVTGDTKVVERGHGDGLTITTAGIGLVPPGIDLGPGRVTAGDAVIVSGTIGRPRDGDHERPRGSRVRGGDSERHRGPARSGGRDARGLPERCGCSATRPAAAWRPASTRSPTWPDGHRDRRAGDSGRPGRGERLRDPRPRSAAGGQRGQAPGGRAGRLQPTPCWPRCGPTSTAAGPRCSAGSWPITPAWSPSGRRSAAAASCRCRSASSCRGSVDPASVLSCRQPGDHRCGRGSPSENDAGWDAPDPAILRSNYHSDPLILQHGRTRPDARPQLLHHQRTRSRPNRQAADRSLLAWIRTSLAIISLGFGIERLGQAANNLDGAVVGLSPVKTRMIGAALILLGIGATLSGMWEHRHTLMAVSKTKTIATLIVRRLLASWASPWCWSASPL